MKHTQPNIFGTIQRYAELLIRLASTLCQCLIFTLDIWPLLSYARKYTNPTSYNRKQKRTTTWNLQQEFEFRMKCPNITINIRTTCVYTAAHKPNGQIPKWLQRNYTFILILILILIFAHCSNLIENIDGSSKSFVKHIYFAKYWNWLYMQDSKDIMSNGHPAYCFQQLRIVWKISRL